MLEKDSFQAGLLEAPLLTEEFDNIARKLICTQIGLPRDIRGKLGRRLTAWVSELADVEDIDGIDFEDPKLSRIIALINLEDEFQRYFRF